MGLDAHRSSVVVVAQGDNSAPKALQRFVSSRLLEWIAKLKSQGHRIITVYEASGFGFALHRESSRMSMAQILDVRSTGIKKGGP